MRENSAGNGFFVLKIKNAINKNIIIKTKDLSFQTEIWKTVIRVNTITDITFDSSGNIFGCGFTDSNFYGTAQGREDMVIFKLRPETGTIWWGKMIGGSYTDKAFKLFVDLFSNVWIFGITSSSLFECSGSNCHILLKINSGNGRIVNTKSLTSSSNSLIDFSINPYKDGFLMIRCIDGSTIYHSNININTVEVNSFTQQTNSAGIFLAFKNDWIVRSDAVRGYIKNSLMRMNEIIISTTSAPTTTLAPTTSVTTTVPETTSVTTTVPETTSVTTTVPETTSVTTTVPETTSVTTTVPETTSVTTTVPETTSITTTVPETTSVTTTVPETTSVTTTVPETTSVTTTVPETTSVTTTVPETTSVTTTVPETTSVTTTVPETTSVTTTVPETTSVTTTVPETTSILLQFQRLLVSLL